MNVLILGSGGREHALAWKISQSPLCGKLFMAPGNAGTAALGENLPVKVNDFAGIKKAVLENGIDFVVVGPEDPLVNGVYDFFKADEELSRVAVFGPSKEGAASGRKQRICQGIHGAPRYTYRRIQEFHP